MHALWWVTLAGLLVVGGSVVLVPARAPRPQHVSAAITRPRGLPNHFGLGLTAHPDASGLDGWMPASHVAWDYAYQYLSGGVNTGRGWDTWAAQGRFALLYARDAASHGYLPVFTYFNLLQSKGHCQNCGEARTDLTNLNDPALLARYFRNFALLMQQLGRGIAGGGAGFGKTAIVHVEPDLSGYAEHAVLSADQCFGYCTATGNNPALLKAAVSRSGYAPVRGYPDTYQGFNGALLHLRDLYAPNVLVAFHVSNWATRIDIGTNTSPVLDAAALGTEAGTFAAASGVRHMWAHTSTYDLLFNDVSDRDAAYYDYVYFNPHTWWDRQNVTFPNFSRWEAYLAAAGKAAGRPAIVWQIPEGNQYFDTENNTLGHYQDNRAEYFLTHIAELVRAGVIGLLFGLGNGGSTTHSDADRDGVTNPPGICTRDGLSRGQICANHRSTLADDDGGYLRLTASLYYAAGGYPLDSTGAALPRFPVATPGPTTAAAAPLRVTISTVRVNPARFARGGRVTLSATVIGSAAVATVIIDLEVYRRATPEGGKIYQTFQAVPLVAATPRTIVVHWTVPASFAPGTYRLKVGVFGAGWSPLYAWNNVGALFTVTVA